MEVRDVDVLRADLFAAHRHVRTLRNVCRDVLRATSALQEDLAGLADELGIQLEDTAEGGHSHERHERTRPRDAEALTRCVV